MVVNINIGNLIHMILAITLTVAWYIAIRNAMKIGLLQAGIVSLFFTIPALLSSFFMYSDSLSLVPPLFMGYFSIPFEGCYSPAGIYDSIIASAVAINMILLINIVEYFLERKRTKN